VRYHSPPFSDLDLFLQKGNSGSNDCSPAITFIINNIIENLATKVAFPRQFREVKFGNATREEALG
jgi:hypothetical protein